MRDKRRSSVNNRVHDRPNGRPRHSIPKRAPLPVAALFALAYLIGFTPGTATATVASCTAEAVRGIAPIGVTVKDIPDLAPLPDMKFPRTSNGVAYVAANAVTKGSPEFCLVTGTMVTNANTHKTLNFAVGLPAGASWNQKFLFQACGYHCGAVFPPALAEVKKGYPVWSTDDGHVAKPGLSERLESAIDTSWAITTPGKKDADAVTDFMHRAVHTVTELGKAFTRRFYAADKLDRAYLLGCSDGGREGMVELGTYPADYDGMVAGAPYFDMSNELYTTLVGVLAQLRTREAAIPIPLYEMLNRAVTARCDAADGTPDGLIQNPAQCAFDPQKDLPRCASGRRTAECFTQDQIDSLSIIFSAVRSPSGEIIYPGYSFSDPQDNLAFWLGFQGPANNLVGPDPWSDNPLQQPIGWYLASAAIKYFVYNGAPDFNPLKAPGITFKRDNDLGIHAVIPPRTVSDITRSTREGSIGSIPNAAAEYLRQGRKLILYHGYSDGLITPYRTIQYYRALARLHGGYAQLQRSAQLYIVPNMSHCYGGSGPNTFGQMGLNPNQPIDPERDVLTALERWVEHGEQPTHLLATRYEDNDESKRVLRTMPLCPFPSMAKFNGSGDVNDANNWSCPAGDTRLEKTGPAGARAGVNAPLKN